VTALSVAKLVGGGQTVNPSTEDILAAVESVPSNEVLLLPNNGNVVMTAQHQFVEVQGTGEGGVFDRGTMDKLVSLAEQGISQLLEIQKRYT